MPEWRSDNCYLRYAVGIPLEDIRGPHAQAKKDLLQQVRWLTGVQLDEKVFTSVLPGAPRVQARRFVIYRPRATKTHLPASRVLPTDLCRQGSSAR